MTSGAQLVIAATFTADPVCETLDFWAGELGWSAAPVLAPYAQVYPQLLQPSSALRGNGGGANIVLVRWCDLASGAGYDQAVAELARALRGFSHDVPLLVGLCPEAGASDESDRANEALAAGLAGVSGVSVELMDRYFALYDVADPFDLQAEETGHLPYTPAAMAAIASGIARWYDVRRRPPVKLIASDCDNTLWQGVLGEDGPLGVALSSGHDALQDALVRQAQNGRLICLLSKNDQTDVDQLLAERSDFPLRDDHIIAKKINWEPKPENITSLAEELSLGLDSIVFLDDSTVECATMRAFVPAVQTVKVPQGETELTRFTDHLWLFDQVPGTEEDRARVRMYRDQAEREQSRRAAPSLQDFFATLELEIAIETPTAEDLARFAQLTQRTNQFNASMKRLSLEEVRGDAEAQSVSLRIIRARDRFGDYGIVGAVRAEAKNGTLVADIFLLSCRALGRGIEHQMVATLGRLASEQGCADLRIGFAAGPRNLPARQFLEALGPPGRFDEGAGLSLPATQAMAVRFDPAAARTTDTETVQTVSPAATQSPAQSGPVYEHIATRMTTAADILAAIAGTMADRPALAAAFVAPGTQTEKTIAAIWQDVLHVAPVGIHDPFAELGGKSIQLVQIHALLQARLEITFEFTSLFEYATIADLAGFLDRSTDDTAAQVATRGEKMRNARARRARVQRRKREAVS